MRPLRYSINVTLDGCCDHREMTPDPDSFQNSIAIIQQADALLFGRVTYHMMESYWRPLASDPTEPFAHAIHAAKKYVVSGSLAQVDWNAELLRPQSLQDLGNAVQQLKDQPGNGLLTGGVTLPMALAELDLIDEYEFIVHPRIAGHGPTLFAGLPKHVNLKLLSRQEFGSGAVAMRYEARR
jgi:dihydrofolate reductase